MRNKFVSGVVARARELAALQPGPCALPEALAGGGRWHAASWQRVRGTDFFAVRDGVQRYLVAAGPEVLPAPCPGEGVSAGDLSVKIAPRGSEACAFLHALLPFTCPAPLPAGRPSFGCGDRLGVASPGHLRALKRAGVAPILAQQSVRELTLTGRSYRDVVDAATWAVFQEGYTGGFGADGDHLKTAEEVSALLDAGATFITLDLSLCLGRAELAPELPAALSARAGTRWEPDGVSFSLSAEDVSRFWQVYGPAFPFIEEAHALCVAQRGPGGYDLEVSVDETSWTTRPVDHLLLAMELERRGIPVASVAPRFPGEFQKGIDYIGDLAVLEAELVQHAAIARAYRHKLGIHSGSDKFAAFPLIGRYGGPWLHVKTAGTSWLEALRVIAAVDPALFRACWAQADEGFARAKHYYHIRTERADVDGAESVPDEALPALLDQEAPRQFLHITYGEILRAAAPGGGTLGERIQTCLAEHEEAYAAGLERHFQRHLDGLGG